MHSNALGIKKHRNATTLSCLSRKGYKRRLPDPTMSKLCLKTGNTPQGVTQISLSSKLEVEDLYGATNVEEDSTPRRSSKIFWSERGWIFLPNTGAQYSAPTAATPSATPTRSTASTTTTTSTSPVGEILCDASILIYCGNVQYDKGDDANSQYWPSWVWLKKWCWPASSTATSVYSSTATPSCLEVFVVTMLTINNSVIIINRLRPSLAFLSILLHINSS